MMADDQQIRELRSRSQILVNEDDSVTERSIFGRETWSKSYSSSELSLFGSDLNSSVESELGSTEIESEDDDDYIAELTRQMAQYMLDDDKNAIPSTVADRKDEQSWNLVGSPQSTLWSALGSSQGSPEGPSQEPSPPATPAIVKDRGWNGPNDVVRRLENPNLSKNDVNHPLAKRPNSVAVSVESSTNIGIQSNQELNDYQRQAIQFYKLKREQTVKQKQAKPTQQSESKDSLQQSEKKVIYETDSRSRTSLLGISSNTWSAPPQQANSGMRAVFLGGSGLGSGSCGTGVFLPRKISNSSESRKNQGCSTVLIPARVVQALKLHYDKMGTTSRANFGGFPLQQDDLVGGKNGMYTLKKIHLETAQGESQNEVGLPQEWTY